MGIGAAIFLMALGAILTFAVDFSVSGLDIAVVGVVLMVAGAAGLILDLAFFGPRRRGVVYDQTPTQASSTEVYPEAPDYQRSTEVYEEQPAGRSWRRRRVTNVYRD